LQEQGYRDGWGSPELNKNYFICGIIWNMDTEQILARSRKFKADVDSAGVDI